MNARQQFDDIPTSMNLFGPMKRESVISISGGQQPASLTHREWDVPQFEAMLNASVRLSRLDEDARDKVIPMLSASELETLADSIENDLQAENFSGVVDGLIEGAVHYSNSGYLCQQLNFPVPGAAIGALWASLLNQGQAVFSMSPITSVIEKRMLNWARQRLRLSHVAFGLSTGGGSLANLTALLAARNKLDQWKTWKQGVGGDMRLIVSRHAHYSMAKAAAILGIGEQNVEAVETDTNGRIDLDKVSDILASEHPCIVCLTAGTTFTGAFDDIQDFFARNADIDRRRVWVHVDAAHGGSLYAVDKVSAQFDALAFADSVCWDLHKVFFQSVPLSFLFFRDRATADHVSQHSTSYLTQEVEGAYPDMHNWTLECSRTANAIKLWVSLNTTGEKAIVENINHLIRITDEIYIALSQISALQIYAPPTCNILCFRANSKNDAESYLLTKELFKRINNAGFWSVGHVHLDGYFYIKICCMNPRFSMEHVKEFVSEVERQVRTLAAVSMANYGSAGNDALKTSEAVW